MNSASIPPFDTPSPPKRTQLSLAPSPSPLGTEDSYIPVTATTNRLLGPRHNRRAYRSSATWTTSSGDLGGLSDTDDVQDRFQFVEEYNKLAKKHGVRLLVPEDYDRLTMDHADPFPHEHKRGWFSRAFRRQASGISSASSVKSDRKIHHKRSFSDMAMHIVHPAKRDSLKDADLQSLVRLCGKSFLYLPSEYAPGSLILPTCFRATAQYLVQHATTTRGIFRIPGSIRVVGALYDYYGAEQDPDGISSTIRCPNLPLHIKASVHDVASTFKKFLAGLPGGILGSLSLFDAFVAIHSQLKGQPELYRTKQSKLRARLIALAVGSLRSQFRRELICAVFGLLCLIGRTAEKAPREDENGHPLPTTDLMGYSALGIVFGPLLVGDLLNSYTMKIANPSAGLMLFPLTPPKVRRDRRKSKTEEESVPNGLTVDKILVANGIAEMLITHWRDVVEQMKSLKLNCLGILRSSQSQGSHAAQVAPNSWLRPSASESFVIRHPARWGAKNSPPSSRGAVDSPIPPSPTPAARAGSSEQSGGEHAHARLNVRRKRPKGGRVLSRNCLADKQQKLLSPTVEEPPLTTPDKPAVEGPSGPDCMALPIVEKEHTHSEVRSPLKELNSGKSPVEHSPKAAQQERTPEDTDEKYRDNRPSELPVDTADKDQVLQRSRRRDASGDRFTAAGHRKEIAEGRRNIKGKSTLSSGGSSMGGLRLGGALPGFRVLRPKKSTIKRVTRSSSGDRTPDSKGYQTKTPWLDARNFPELEDTPAELVLPRGAGDFSRKPLSGSQVLPRTRNSRSLESFRGEGKAGATTLMQFRSPGIVTVGNLSMSENQTDSHSLGLATKATTLPGSQNDLRQYNLQTAGLTNEVPRLRRSLEERSNRLDRRSRYQTDLEEKPSSSPQRLSRESLRTVEEPRLDYFTTLFSLAHLDGLKSTKNAVKVMAARFENASKGSNPALPFGQSGRSRGESKSNNVVSHYTTNASPTKTPLKQKRPANSDSVPASGSVVITAVHTEPPAGGDVVSPEGQCNTPSLEDIRTSGAENLVLKDMLTESCQRDSPGSDETVLRPTSKSRAERKETSAPGGYDASMDLTGKYNDQLPEPPRDGPSPDQDTVLTSDIGKRTVLYDGEIVEDRPVDFPQAGPMTDVKEEESQSIKWDRVPDVLPIGSSPGQTGNSSLHAQVRRLQRQLNARDEENNQLRRQLETRESADVSALNEQLRIARTESRLWKARAEAAERRVATYSRFTAQLRQLKEKSFENRSGRPLSVTARMIKVKQEDSPYIEPMDGHQDDRHEVARGESSAERTEDNEQFTNRIRKTLGAMDGGADSRSEASLEQELLDDLRVMETRSQMIDAAVRTWMEAQEAIEYEDMEMVACPSEQGSSG